MGRGWIDDGSLPDKKVHAAAKIVFVSFLRVPHYPVFLFTFFGM
jgi:hypothetical protein